MKSWQDRMADIIEFLGKHFPEVHYRACFDRSNVKIGDTTKPQWRCYVESVRRDGGPHDNTVLAPFYIQVQADEVEQLPALMLEKAAEVVLKWQEDGLVEIRQKAKELEEARNKFNTRIGVGETLQKLKEQVKQEEPNVQHNANS